MHAPVYLEVFPLLLPNLTGIGRFSARLVEVLARCVPLRLTSFVEPRTARIQRLNPDLACGQEIAIEPGELPHSGDDLVRWVHQLCERRKRPHDPQAAARSTGIYTWSRPQDRRFRNEIGIFYDFTPLIVPWSHTLGLRQGFCRQVTASRHCNKVVAISESTRADAAWLSPVPPDDVVVAYPGPSQCLERHAHGARVERRENAMLVVSTREPRKNGDFLLDWFLNTELLDERAELWWAGPDGWLWDAPRAGRKGGRLERVKFLGMVSDARLCELYQQAAFTIYPSLYEGFGFPVLDSLLHGTPVLASYNSSLAELETAGVFYFDPCDAETLDEALRELQAARPIEIDATELRRRFSWGTLAQTVLGLVA